MTPDGTTTPVGRTRRRPADRRDEILVAAAEAFSAGGFHATRLASIADQVGISTPALYRHFSSKYDLFVGAALLVAETLSTAAASVRPDDDPDVELAALMHAIGTATFQNRAAGNIYRWESQFLAPADRTLIVERRSDALRRIKSLISRRRPGVSRRDLDLLATATLSTIVSPVTHRVASARRPAIEALVDASIAVSAVELPPVDDDRRAPDPVGLAPTARREAILTESIALFARHGFGAVTMEQIGAAVGLPPSGIYRHFDSKSAILAAALWRASDRTTASIASGLASAATPQQAVVALAEQYATLCVADPDIMTVFLSELGSLDADDLRALRRQQRVNVDEWATWVTRARPDLTSATARFLVHAALNVAGDLPINHPGVDAATVACATTAVLVAPVR